MEKDSEGRHIEGHVVKMRNLRKSARSKGKVMDNQVRKIGRDKDKGKHVIITSRCELRWTISKYGRKE